MLRFYNKVIAMIAMAFDITFVLAGMTLTRVVVIRAIELDDYD